MPESLAHLLDTPQLLALAAALGWASGFRLYAAVFLAGLAGWLGWVELPPGLHILQHPALLVASGSMLLAEFFADKIPLLDSMWDAVHTFIRIPAGAALAAGGSLAATSHATKMTTRAAVNLSPEPFSNTAVSLAEDGLVVFMLWLSATHPVAFAIVLAVSIVLAVVLLVVLVKVLRTVLRGLGQFFKGRPLPRELG